MLAIGSDRLGEPEERQGERWLPIPGIVVRVSGWKETLYALYFLPDTKRLKAEAVTQPYNPAFTKRRVLGSTSEESATVVVAGYIFVVNNSRRNRARHLEFRWIDPSQQKGEANG